MMATRTADQTATTKLRDDSFIGLPLFAFAYPGVSTVDLYAKGEDESGIKLICDRRRGLAPNELGALTERGVNYLLVRQSDFDKVTSALFENLDAIVADNRYVAGQRLVLVQAAACQPLEAAYRLMNCDQYIGLARSIGGCIGLLTQECTHNALQLFGVLQHGPTHAVHATNVAVYSSLMAKLFGETNTTRLQQIAMGAMLHDLGLRRRRGSHGRPLGWSESVDQTSSHPQVAYEELCERTDVTRDQMLMAYQHQEHVDGSGGPVGLVADEIHPWSRILAVANRFDELTCDRPSRPRLPIPNALASVATDAGSCLDAGIVECWTNAFQTQ